MELEKYKKWCFPPSIPCRWNGHPGTAAGDGNCILITGLMVSVMYQMEGPFYREAHSLPLSIFPLMVVNKTQQEMKVMRLCSDPVDFISNSVAWLGSSVISWLLWKRCSFRHFNKWRRKDETGGKERFFFLFLHHPCGYFIAYKAL